MPDSPTPNDTGARLIADERWRQIEREGYTAEYDDARPADDLLEAARCYLTSGEAIRYGTNCVTFNGGFRPGEGVPRNWPWDEAAWKPSGDLVRDLVRAGALIAARIDCELRARSTDA